MAEVVKLRSAPMSISRILLVEDSASDAVLIKKALTKAMLGNCRIRHEQTLEAALKALGEEEYEVALLDLSLPDSTEFDGLSSIQNLAPALPVVILTGYADESMAMQAVERGAQDYLFKDKADGQSVLRAMQYAVQRKQFEAALINQANFDTLTGLPNRSLFESRLEMALARCQRSRSGIGLFFLDLNHFKTVNDTFGHAAGDRLLQQVAEQLRQSVRPYDTPARFGGDEFALLIEGIEQPRDCASIAQKVLSRIVVPFRFNHKTMEIGVSIGIATHFGNETIGSEALMKQADEAMYRAKLSSHSNYRFYTQEIHEDACARLKLEDELREALAYGQLTLHYQPKIALRSGKTAGVEALVRWNHPQRGLLLPGEFMAALEETGLAKDLGAWVFKAVCSDLARWKKAGLPLVRVSINLSTTQLDDPLFVDMLRKELETHQISSSLIALEIPSSASLEHMGIIRSNTLADIGALGIALHLDHFGVSAISLAALKALPIEAIKIAPELTRTINEPDGMLPLVQAIIDIAKRFNLEVVAAGIENDRQQAFFKERGCLEGQGFGLCRPLPGEYMPDWLKT